MLGVFYSHGRSVFEIVGGNRAVKASKPEEGRTAQTPALWLACAMKQGADGSAPASGAWWEPPFTLHCRPW